MTPSIGQPSSGKIYFIMISPTTCLSIGFFIINPCMDSNENDVQGTKKDTAHVYERTVLLFIKHDFKKKYL